MAHDREVHRRGLAQRSAALLCGLVLLAAAARPVGSVRADSGASVTDVSLAGGATNRVVLLTPPGSPKAVLIMFPGADGVLHIRPDGVIGAPGNFLVRTRDLWVQQGYAVLVPDVPSNSPQGLMGHRLTHAYGDVIGRLVDFAQAETHAPVWLVGTSAGSPAAAFGASLLPRDRVAGVVLTSSVSVLSRNEVGETVFQVDLKKISVPALIVSNTLDQCPESPAGNGPRIKAALSAATPAEFQTVSGGSPPTSGPCDPYSYHGFFGIEAQVAQLIAGWIAAHS